MKKILGVGLLIVIGAVFGLSQLLDGKAADKQQMASQPKQVITKSALQRDGK